MTKRTNVWIALGLVGSAALGPRCSLDEDAAKNRCTRSSDCLGARRCVAGYCRSGASGSGVSLGGDGTGGRGESGEGNGGRGGSGADSGGTHGGAGATGAAGASDDAGAAGDNGGTSSGRDGGEAGTGGVAGSGGASSGGVGGNAGVGPGGLGGAGGASAGVGGGETCPEMVRLPQGFCIDSTEVTRLAYRTWLATNPPIPNTVGCETNGSLAPTCTWLLEHDLYPATCLDWCDAHAYCEAQGKRLCGKIGGGPSSYNTGNDDAEENEWYAACSSRGENNYPYGDDYVAGQCVDESIGMLRPAGGTPGCRPPPGPYHCLFDLSGNALEWEDSCSGDEALAYCRARGGAAEMGVRYELSCRGWVGLPRVGTVGGRAFGIRCCADDCD